MKKDSKWVVRVGQSSSQAIFANGFPFGTADDETSSLSFSHHCKNTPLLHYSRAFQRDQSWNEENQKQKDEEVGAGGIPQSQTQSQKDFEELLWYLFGLLTNPIILYGIVPHTKLLSFPFLFLFDCDNFLPFYKASKGIANFKQSKYIFMFLWINLNDALSFIITIIFSHWQIGLFRSLC